MSKFTRRPLSLAIRAIGMAGTLSLAATPAHAAFEEVTTDNPFADITSGTRTVSLVLQDYDDDGDLDAVVFHAAHEDAFPFSSNDMSFYENTGTARSPEFTQIQDNSGYGYGGDNFDVNPFAYNWCCSGYGHPVTAGDLNGDDVADLVGGINASTNVRETVGLVQTDAYGVASGFSLRESGYKGTTNPFYATNIMNNAFSYGYASALLVDLDNDTDMDVVTIDNAQIRVFQNNGTDAYGVLQLNELTGDNNPFYAGSGSNLWVSGNYYGAALAAGDVDNDGDMDVIMGVRTGPADLRLYINEGSASTAAFVEVTGEDFTAATGESFDASTAIAAAPVMADIDRDGDDDLVIVEEQVSGAASFRLFENDSARPVIPDDDDDDGFLGGTGLGALLLGAMALLFRRRR